MKRWRVWAFLMLVFVVFMGLMAWPWLMVHAQSTSNVGYLPSSEYNPPAPHASHIVLYDSTGKATDIPIPDGLALTLGKYGGLIGILVVVCPIVLRFIPKSEPGTWLGFVVALLKLFSGAVPEKHQGDLPLKPPTFCGPSQTGGLANLLIFGLIAGALLVAAVPGHAQSITSTTPLAVTTNSVAGSAPTFSVDTNLLWAAPTTEVPATVPDNKFTALLSLVGKRTDLGLAYTFRFGDTIEHEPSVAAMYSVFEGTNSVTASYSIAWQAGPAVNYVPSWSEFDIGFGARADALRLSDSKTTGIAGVVNNNPVGSVLPKLTIFRVFAAGGVVAGEIAHGADFRVWVGGSLPLGP